MSASFNSLYFAHIKVDDVPETIEVLANDGKISANRFFLRIASPAVHTKLVENPDLTILDLKNYRKATIDCLLHGIYTGNTTFNDDIEKETVMRLCQELSIDMKTKMVVEGEAIKVDAPAVPEEEPKNDDPGLMRLKDGRIGCGICFKAFSLKGNAKKHYQNVHMTSKEKNIPCRAPGCDTKLKSIPVMKQHMLKSHGISAKMIPSTSATKSTKSTKKTIKKEPSKKVVKEDEPQKMDVKQEAIEY